MTTIINSIPQATAAFSALRGFISPAQMSEMASVCRSEEKKFMFDKLSGLVDTIATMPKTYETDGQGSDAVAFLHYFARDCDWYITEKDMEAEQLQAFGLCCIWEGELGYVSIKEIIEAGAELDLYFEPITLKEIKRRREIDSALNNPNSTAATCHY